VLIAVVFFVNSSLSAHSQSSQERRGQDSSAEAQLQKGIALTSSGKFWEAIPYFLTARGQVRNEYAVSFNLALCYVGTGQYPLAIDLLNELRSSGAENADVENLLAQALLGSRQTKEAVAAFERGARLAGKNEKFYLYIAESCMDNGYYDVGLKVVETGLRHLPRSPRLTFEHGMLLAELDLLDEAKQELQRVTELAPGSDVAYIAAAQKSLMEGNVAEAVRVAHEGIRKGNQHFMLLALYGEAVMRSGVEPGTQEFARAHAALEQAVSEHPTYPGARISLGKLYLMEDRLNDAVTQLNAARELDPRNPAVYSNLAAAYRQRGETEHAEEMLAVLARLNQEQVERIRSAPGDRKAGYAAKPRPPLDPRPYH
jgi:tetratricopeptide (TPR) repeat protein